MFYNPAPLLFDNTISTADLLHKIVKSKIRSSSTQNRFVTENEVAGFCRTENVAFLFKILLLLALYQAIDFATCVSSWNEKFR